MECRRMFGHGFDFFGKIHIPAETRVHAGENARNRFWIGQKPAEKSTLEFCAKLHFLRCPHIFLKNHQPLNSLGSTQEWHTFSSRHTQELNLPCMFNSAELNLCCNMHSVQLSRGDEVYSGPTQQFKFPASWSVMFTKHVFESLFSKVDHQVSLVLKRHLVPTTTPSDGNNLNFASGDCLGSWPNVPENWLVWSECHGPTERSYG